MKNTGNSTRNHNSAGAHVQRPENKDNLDSRKKEEQLRKGADFTHNHKETKNDKK